MESAGARGHVRASKQLFGLPQISAGWKTSGVLKAGFATSLGAYLLLKVAGVVWHVSPLVDLTIVPAGLCALIFALQARTHRLEADLADEAESSMRAGLIAGAVLLVFTVTYLAVNTVPVVTSQDESAIVNGGHELATHGSLRVTSPLNDQYDTNIIGALHVMYRTPTDMYYRTFPGTAALYAPFSLLPGGLDYRMFTAVFGALTIAALYAVGWKLLRSWQAGAVAALALTVSPVFGHWAVTVFNNVAVLALELVALAVVLWAPRERVLAFAAAGAFVSIAFFARITEFVYVLPLLGLVFWRTRSWRQPAAFAAVAAAGVGLIAFTNQLFYHDVLFLPHVGQPYIALGDSNSSLAPSAIIDRYAQFSTGTKNAGSGYDATEKLANVWFHVRYLASSTFAFPFIALAFAGLVWRALAGRRSAWLLVAIAGVAIIAVLGIYGQQQHNYYGYGQPIVRSSFARYALPIYAALALAVGAFFLEVKRLSYNTKYAMLAPAALIAVVAVAGVAKSYDARVYGFNLLNDYRETDRAAWGQLRDTLDAAPERPLVVGGPSVEKLIDSEYEQYFINYGSLPELFRIPLLLDVSKRVSVDRPVYVISSDVNEGDKQLLEILHTQFRPHIVSVAGQFHVRSVQFVPPEYKLLFVDVWNTYDAYDRWSVTADGYLQPIGDVNYIHVLPATDQDGDGKLDQQVVLQVEVSGGQSRDPSISALEARGEWQPRVLWSTAPGQSNDWQTVTIVLPKGATYQSSLIASRGLLFRSIAVVQLGPK